MSHKLEQARVYEKKALSQIPEEQRPAFHFSAPTGWMNDPNGFSRYGEEYHLFFQYYPYDVKWNSMHWGHAKSKDFIKWEYLPTALAPDEKYDNAGVFSGSAIEYDGKQILMYTGVTEEELPNGEKQVRQNQCIAIGDGLDYKKADCNPVITSDMLPEGSSLEDFRDPKIWKENGMFFAVAGSRNADGSGQIALFSSEDFLTWSFRGILDRSRNLLGKMWECPDFFRLEEQSVMIVSPQDMNAEKLEFHNGNNVVFLLGKYNAEKLQFERKQTQCVDYGLDFYAAQTMSTADGRRIMIAWMQSWDNPMLPTGFCWSGMMTVPRELVIKNNRVYQMPVRELEAYYANEVCYNSILIREETSLEGISGRILDISVDILGGNYEKFEMKVAADEKRYSQILIDRREETLTFDRTYAGYARDVISRRSMKVDCEKGRMKLRVLIDVYSVEIFVNDGAQAMSSLIFTRKEADKIYFRAWGEADCNIRKYEIRS